MSLIDVKYKEPLNFQGRNGYFKCGGITVIGHKDRIVLCPLTSKMQQGNALIDVPTESIDELVIALIKSKGKE